MQQLEHSAVAHDETHDESECQMSIGDFMAELGRNAGHTMNRKHVTDTAKNVAGEAQQRAEEAAGNKLRQTKNAPPQVSGSLWKKSATLDETLDRIDKKKTR
jgi:hypothetical protein